MNTNPQTSTGIEPVPQFDLHAQYAAIRGEVRAALDEVLSSQQFILGRLGAALEEEIARLCGVTHGVGVASGTDALILALRACGVNPGDEVILPAFTFVATASAVSALGARPVFADIRPDTFNLDPAELMKRATPRTRAILAVHLFGLVADVDSILEFARPRGIHVIEDSAQAVGASYKDRPAGSLGDAGCLSFYPTKNLGAYGDGGMIVTNSAAMAERLRVLRNHGQSGRYESSEPGWNSRLDEIQAAVLRVKLRHLPEWQRARQAHAAEYDLRLRNVRGIVTPACPSGCGHAYNQYTIRVSQRDEVRKFLAARNIGSSIYYPAPLHLQPLYSALGHKPGDFPEAERACAEVLSLPMYPELRAGQIARVVEAVSEAVAQ